MNAIRYSLRVLFREPGFAAVAILTAALGIGINTAIFSIVNGVLLRPLPYSQPDRLVNVREVIPSLAQTYPTLPVSARHFTEWRQHTNSFARLSAVDTGTAALTGAGEPEQIDIARTSADLFETLGVPAAIGRTFVEGEDQQGHDRVAVITDSLWRRRFHADPAMVGRTIQLDSVNYTLIGILPASFRFPSARMLEVGQASLLKPEVFRPIVFSDEELKQLMGNFNYTVIARLKPGVAPERARSELNVIAKQLEKSFGTPMNLQTAVIPMRDSIVGKSRRGLVVLLGAVGAVLLIVCVNLANLLLARSERRARDWAVRTALGAGRKQLLIHALTETTVFALLGGILGVAVASAGLGTLIRNAPADLPRLDEVHLDPRVLLFALGVTVLTAVLFGLAPAWRATLADPQDALKSGGRAISGTRAGARLRSTLVGAETGLSVLLLVTAALLTNSFARLLRAEQGFSAPTVLAADVRIPAAKYKDPRERNDFHERVLARLQSQPGVVSAAIITALPLTGETWIDTVSVVGDNRPLFAKPPVNIRFASAEYFRTMGIPLIAGRTFSDSDRKRSVAVISEKVAHMLWPNQNALGREFTNGDTKYEVIGIARDVRAEPQKPPVSIVYRPYWNWAPSRVMLVARAHGDPRSIGGAIREAVRSVDPDVPAPQLQTMQEVLTESLAQRRFQMLLAAAFAATALLLSALGIYAVVSYSVTRRRNEMGVRMALGAQARDLNLLVIGQAMRPVLIGMAAGVALALAAGRVLSSLLYEIKPGDPAILGAVAGTLLIVALAACFVPAFRAGRVAPLDALRYE